MKEKIHPDYHEITVIMTDGTKFKTRSTYGKPGDELRLDIDPTTHPAWTGGLAQVKNAGQVAKFNKRFAGLGLGGSSEPSNKNEKKADAKPAAKAEKKAEKKEGE